MAQAAAGGGGGGVQATYGPMSALASQLSGQAAAWTAQFAVTLGQCGNPALDSAIGSFGRQLRTAVGELAGSSQTTSGFVTTCSANFASADGGA